MSTLKVNNIKDASGGTSNLKIDGAAKAWVNFNGTGTVAISDDLNVSSITDGGTGNYTVNFTSNMPNANYAVCLSSNMVASNSFAAFERVESIATSSFVIRTIHSSGFQDVSVVCAAVFGD